MKRLVILACAAVAVTAVVAFPATANKGNLDKSNVDRVMVDVTVQVVQLPDLFNPDPQQLGVAHVQVHAYDLDAAAPLELSGQTADGGWVSCEPVLSAACSVLPTTATSILWVDLTSSSDPNTASISFSTGSSSGGLLTLHDGGTPGNKLTGETSVTGSAQTADWLRWGDWRGRPAVEGWVLSGNVTIDRD
jgi:hypothetical protein